MGGILRAQSFQQRCANAKKVAILSLADRTGRAKVVPCRVAIVPGTDSLLAFLPLVAMSLGYEIVVGVLLFVGHSISTGELPVNGFPTDADFNWRLGGEGLELRP
jgi:hypothetical protein